MKHVAGLTIFGQPRKMYEPCRFCLLEGITDEAISRKCTGNGGKWRHTEKVMRESILDHGLKYKPRGPRKCGACGIVGCERRCEKRKRTDSAPAVDGSE
jgi:hypothetical protein